MSTALGRDRAQPAGAANRPASGEQYALAVGDQLAVVTEVGATLRRYDVGDVPVCLGFEEDEVAPASRGQLLAPWPSRIVDGVYEFDGVRAQAPINDYANNNAIHGFVRWLAWELVEQTPSSVVLSCLARAQPAYPFTLRMEIGYTLSDAGLEVRTSATNEGRRRAPFGMGFHSYVHAGGGLVDDCSLRLPARSHVVIGADRRPVGTEPVAGTPYEALCGLGGESGGKIGALRLQDAFTDLVPDEGGRWHARFTRGTGPLDHPSVWADEGFRWVMIYSGDSPGEPSPRRALAIEPLTCPPNAMASGDGLVVLEPGESFEARWGIDPTSEPAGESRVIRILGSI